MKTLTATFAALALLGGIAEASHADCGEGPGGGQCANVTVKRIYPNSAGTTYIDTSGTESWSPYMLALIFLLFRPQGLFGEKIIERV